MAEQSSHDVVKQTLSGGEPSPSDVPASTNDKHTAGGDVGEFNHTASTTQPEITVNTPHDERKTNAESSTERNETGRTDGKSSTVSLGRPFDSCGLDTEFGVGYVKAESGAGSHASTGNERSSVGVGGRGRYGLAGWL